jgi:hypothetical protein
MRHNFGWLATIAAALISLAACIAAAWYLFPWDLATRIAVGTSAGVVAGAVVALWGAERNQPARTDEGRNPAASIRQDIRDVSGSSVIQAGGDVKTGNLQHGGPAALDATAEHSPERP